MLRKIFFPKSEKRQKWSHLRGHDVKRIETFSDAVFAFAVTLLIVSLEVPKSFEELILTMRGFFAFGICFTLLMLIWYQQHVFFRRYGMEDITTVVLNAALMFIVLFYVYPLKFLFTMVFSDNIDVSGKSPFSITTNQVPNLMIIYGLGYVTIYFIFLLLYLHAHRNRIKLQLTTLELFDTRTTVFSQIILISIGGLSIITALSLPAKRAGLAGLVYGLIGIALSIYYRIRRKMRKRVHHENSMQ